MTDSAKRKMAEIRSFWTYVIAIKSSVIVDGAWENLIYLDRKPKRSKK